MLDVVIISGRSEMNARIDPRTAARIFGLSWKEPRIDTAPQLVGSQRQFVDLCCLRYLEGLKRTTDCSTFLKQIL